MFFPLAFNLYPKFYSDFPSFQPPGFPASKPINPSPT
jgi:hypothetical protein